MYKNKKKIVFSLNIPDIIWNDNYMIELKEELSRSEDIKVRLGKVLFLF